MVMLTKYVVMLHYYLVALYMTTYKGVKHLECGNRRPTLWKDVQPMGDKKEVNLRINCQLAM
jgi:hypothetical protein